MRDFFRGWRRKAGVVPLLMACVFLAGWVRSRTIHDTVFLGDIMVLSGSGDFWIGWGSDTRTGSPMFAWDSYPFTYEMDVVGLPYRWSAVPLTAMSAYLLLSRPRPAKTANQPTTGP